MKWRPISITAVAVFILMGCGHESPPEEKGVLPETAAAQDSLIEVPAPVPADTFRENLRDWFAHPLDFSSIKKKVQMLEMGHCLPDSLYQSAPAGARLYNFGAVYEMLSAQEAKQIPKTDKGMHIFSFCTWKPWQSAKEQYYENDNEILIGFETSLNIPALGEANFVGLGVEEIEMYFGRPDTVIGNTVIYKDQQNVLVLRTKYNKIWRVRMARLHGRYRSLHQTPERVYQFEAN